MDKKTKSVLIYIGELVVMALVTFAVFTYIVKPVHIEGQSMSPTVHDNDLALVNVIGLKTEGLERFDVVIIDSDRLSEHLIKRVIGLPNETITYQDDVLYVDGVAIAEDFLDPEFVETSKQETGSALFTNNFTYTLGEGEYFVMGDNRLRSEDSRALGPFTIDEFMGKNGMAIYPFDHFGWIE